MDEPNQDSAERIHAVVATLAHRATAHEVAAGLVEGVIRELGARAAALFLFDAPDAPVEHVSAHGYAPELLERWARRPLDATLGGAAMVVPLSAGDRTVGCLAVSFGGEGEDEGGRQPGADERDCILALAAHGAQSIERAHLFEAEKRARAEADAARRQLESVLEQLPVALTLVGSDGGIVLNEQVRQLYGTTARSGSQARPASYPAHMMLHADGRPFSEDELPIVRARRGESVSGQEMLFTLADGSLTHLRVNAGPVRDDDGRILSTVAAFADISEERRIESELVDSLRRHQAVMRATNDVIWEMAADGQGVERDGALERMLGHRDGEARGQAEGYAWWQAQIHPDDRSRVVATFEAAQARGDTTWSDEYRLRHADGGYLHVLDRCVIERDASGGMLRAVGAICDVTEQHRLLDDLRGAVSLRDEFLSVAGHELRTPLAALSAQLLGLLELPLDEAQRHKKLSAAERQVRRLSLLTDELLDVSRIAHGALTLELEELDLAELARATAARLAHDFERDGARLELEAAVPVACRCDRARLELLLTNLLSNALRYGERRPVRLTVTSLDGLARLTVEDGGPGIPPEDRERIFERFVSAAPSRRFGGLGVGLWLSRKIVEAHGGRLTLESEPGRGARFRVELPR